MSDFVLETGVVIPAACPTCEPDRDARTYQVRCCTEHEPPAAAGADDALVSVTGDLSGSGDAGGDDNRRFCALLHRTGVST